MYRRNCLIGHHALLLVTARLIIRGQTFERNGAVSVRSGGMERFRGKLVNLIIVLNRICNHII